MVIAEGSLPDITSTHKPFVLFYISCPFKEGSDRAAFGEYMVPSQSQLPPITHLLSQLKELGLVSRTARLCMAQQSISPCLSPTSPQA